MPDYPIEHLPEAGQSYEISPGLHWVRMPLPFALDHINLWVVEEADGLTIIDTGFGLPDIRHHWEALLARFDRPVTRVIVTHCHPDHLGLATWLAAPAGAPILMSQGEFHFAQALWHQLPGCDVTDMLEHFRIHGLDDTRLQALAERGNGYARGIPSLPTRYSRLFHGSRLQIGGDEWQVIVGYGHSPEHVSLYCPAREVLISGDMLLPRISTNISVFAAFPDDDPLGWFLDSLQEFRKLSENTLVLPSHGRPFRGIAGRVDELQQHHADRCDELLAALGTPRCAAELLPVLFPRVLDAHQTLFAMGEAIAHLNHLAGKGELQRVSGDDGILRFTHKH